MTISLSAHRPARSALGAATGAKDEVVGVQYLRAVAAIFVVIHHARDQLPILSHLVPTSAFQGGVDIFFVISGFIMMHTTASRSVTAVQFMERRLARIVPLYWAMSLMTAGLAIVAPRLFRDTVFSVSGLVTSLLFWPTFNAGMAGSITPILKPGWTLNYEMFFYVIFATRISLTPLRRTAALLTVFCVTIAVTALFRPTAASAIFYGNPIVIEFLFGCLIGALTFHGLADHVTPTAAIVALLSGTIWFFAFGGDIFGFGRVATLGFGGALIVGAMVCLDRNGSFGSKRWLARTGRCLGDGSYSIYLVHLFPVIFVRGVWSKLGLPQSGTLPPIVFLLAATATGIVAGMVVYELVERPITRGARRVLAATPNWVAMRGWKKFVPNWHRL